MKLPRLFKMICGGALLLSALLLASCGSTSDSGALTGPKTLAELNADGITVGVLDGSSFDAVAEKNFPNAGIQRYKTNSDLAGLVRSGALDAFITDRPLAESIVSEVDGLTVIGEPIETNDAAFVFSKSGHGMSLASEINAFLSEISADGTLDEITSVWFGKDEDAKTVDIPTSGEKGELTLATYAEVEPFSYIKNGTVTGYDIDIISKFCRKAGYSLNVINMEFPSVMSGISTGKYDLAACCITITDERRESVIFSEPNYRGSVVAVVRGESPLLSEEEAGSGKIAVQTGTSCALHASESFPDAEILNFTTTPDCLTALSEGSADAVFLNKTVADRFIGERGGGFVYYYSEYGNESEGFVFPKTADGKKLRGQFDEFLGKLSESGELDLLKQTWFDDSTDKDGLVPSLPSSGENGTLTLATEGSYYPFSYFVGNSPSGFDIVLAADFCREYGYGLEVSNMSFDGLIPSVLSGKCDFAGSGITITEERRESVDFSDVVSSDALVLLVRSNGGGSDRGFFESVAESFKKTFIREERWKMILEGIGTTVFVSLLSAAAGTVLGFGICMLRRTKSRVFRAVTSVYISILQGTPVVVLLMILFYLVFAKSSISGVWVAVIAFALNFAAYVSEMIRTGIDAVDRGQTEAALALGYTRSAAFFKIVMPQAANHFLPVYRGEFISLVKMTSVVGYIAVQDLTKVSDIIRSRTYEAFFPLIATAAIYFVISWLLALLLKFAQKKTAPDRKKRVVKGVVTE